MKIQADLRRRLKAVLADRATAIAKTVANDGDIDEADIKRLEAYTKILAALPRSKFYDLYPAALIAVSCLLAVSMAWTIRVGKTKIHVAVKTSAVTVRLASPLEWEGAWRLSGAAVHLQEFTALELPPEYRTPHQLADRAWLDIVGGAIKVTSLDLDQGARISIARDEAGFVDILTLDKPFRGRLDLSGTPDVSAGSSPSSSFHFASTTFNPPGTLSFFCAGRPGIPARIRAIPTEKIELRRVLVQAISLFTETTNTEQNSSFVSGIVGGSLSLSDTGESFELKAGDPLNLEGSNGLISLEIGPGGLDFSFDGDARGVLLGTPGAERNLKPSIVEYLYHREKVSFFWGAVTFLWGLIWSARKLFS